MSDILRHDAGQWWIEHRYPDYDRPMLAGVRWHVREARRTGPFAPELADGLAVTSVRDSTMPDGLHTWQAYGQSGDYLVLRALDRGERLPETPIPPPKVRAGVQTRYHQGRWERYLKTRGWESCP